MLKVEYRLKKIKEAFADPARKPSDELCVCGNVRIKAETPHAFANTLENNIAQLPEDMRSVYILTEVEGYNEHEAATLLDIPETNVKPFLQKAKALLGKIFKSWYYHTEIYTFHINMGDHLVRRIMYAIGSDEKHAVMAP